MKNNKEKEGLETSSEEPKAITESSTTDSEKVEATTEGTKTDPKEPEDAIEGIRSDTRREYIERIVSSVDTPPYIRDITGSIMSSVTSRLEMHPEEYANHRQLNNNVQKWFREFDFAFWGYELYKGTKKQASISTDVATVFYKVSCNTKAKEFFLSEDVLSFFKSSYKPFPAPGFKEFTGVIYTALKKQEALYTDEGAPLSKSKVFEVVLKTLEKFPTPIINIIVDDAVGSGDFGSVYESYPTLTMAGEDTTVTYNESIDQMLALI